MCILDMLIVLRNTGKTTWMHVLWCAALVLKDATVEWKNHEEERVKVCLWWGNEVWDKAGGERSPYPAYIALDGVSRDSLAAGALASSRLENDYGLSKAQGLGKGIFFSRFWDSYFPLSIPVLHKYFKLAPVCSQLHIFHVPHFENVTQNCLDLKCKFKIKNWEEWFISLCVKGNVVAHCYF